MLADEVDYVVGVDTHRDQHVLSLVAAPTGAVVAQRSVAARRARLPTGAAVRERARPGCSEDVPLAVEFRGGGPGVTVRR